MLRTTARRLAVPVYAAFTRAFMADKYLTRKGMAKLNRQCGAAWRKLTPAQRAAWEKKAAAMKPKRKVARTPRKANVYAKWVKKNFKKFAHLKTFTARARAMAKAYHAEKK